MARFVFRVRNNNGITNSGVIEANDMAEASRLLHQQGNVIISLYEQTSSTTEASQEDSKKVRARHEEIIFFANQLAVMVETGVSLPDALDCIVQQAEREEFRNVVIDISNQVKGGVEFSTALSKYPKIFNKLFISMVKASEASGTMGKMLQRIAHYLDEQYRIRRQVKGAVAYPIGLLCFCVTVVVIMIVFILPRFEKIYASKGAVLPLPTRILLGISNGLVNNWSAVLAVLILITAGIYFYLQSPNGKMMLDRIKINLPVLGKMFRKRILERSFQTLSTIVDSGVGLLDALEITAEVSGNIFYADIWRKVAAKVKEGSSLSEELSKYPLIPPSVSQMISAGERTGKLGAVLDRLAKFCQQELEIAIKTTTNFIEPAMIMIMGVVVGGVAIAMLLPIFSISRVVAQ